MAELYHNNVHRDSCSDDDQTEIDIEAFVDQEFERITCYTDEELSEIGTIFQDLGQNTSMSVVNHEIICKESRSNYFGGMHAQSDSGSDAHEVHESQNDLVGIGQIADNQKILKSDHLTAELCCQHCKSLVKSFQNGKIFVFKMYSSEFFIVKNRISKIVLNSKVHKSHLGSSIWGLPNQTF